MRILLFISLFFLVFLSCSDDEKANYEKEEIVELTDSIDVYFKAHFEDKYNCAVRWRWIDKYVSIDYMVTPANREVLIPVGKMIERFWIEPFLLVSKGGGDFIRSHFPPEIICVGSKLLQSNGTEVLGYAEAGVRITLVKLDDYDLSDMDWVRGQLNTMHHEFTHIIHQTYNLPVGYKEVNPAYTGNSWNNLKDDEAAIRLGMVTRYGTTNEHEDFCELVAKFLLTEKLKFEQTYLNADPAKPGLDAGKAFIAKKLELTKAYYKEKFDIDLDKLRDIIQERLLRLNSEN